MKKLIVAGLVSMLALTSACGKDDPIKAFEKAVEKTNKIEQSKMSAEGNIEVESSEVTGTAETQVIPAGMEKVEFAMEAQLEKTNMKADINLSAAGISMKMEMYGNEKESIIKMPMTDKYLIMPIGGEGSVDLEANKKEMQEISKGVYTEIVEKVKSNGEITVEEVEFKLPDETKKVSKVNVKLKDADVKAILKDTVEKLYSNEAFRKNMTDELGQPLTEEKAKAQLAEMNKSLAEMKIDDFEFIAYIDDQDYIVGQDIKMKLSENSNSKESVNLDIKTKIWDIGKAQNIKFPELNESNSMKYEDFIKSMQVNPNATDVQTPGVGIE